MTHPPRKYNAWCIQILRRFAPLNDNMAEGTIRLRKIKKRLEGSTYSYSTLKNSSSRISNASSTFQNCCWSVRRRNYFRFKYENTLHSLHEYNNSLSINVSACNVLVFYMSLMSLTQNPKWHQWHVIFVVIARGSIENQKVMQGVQWVQWDFESK